MSSIKSNLFEVSFSKLPGASEEQLQQLSLLCCAATIPGSENKLSISVIADLGMFDLFLNWYNNNFNDFGEASIELFGEGGALIKTYNLTELRIKNVGAIHLEWSDGGKAPNFTVDFDINMVTVVN